jgi:hypothetical protein
VITQWTVEISTESSRISHPLPLPSSDVDFSNTRRLRAVVPKVTTSAGRLSGSVGSDADTVVVTRPSLIFTAFVTVLFSLREDVHDALPFET